MSTNTQNTRSRLSNSGNCSLLSSSEMQNVVSKKINGGKFDEYWSSHAKIQNAIVTATIANLVIAPYEVLYKDATNVNVITVQNVGEEEKLQQVDNNIQAQVQSIQSANYDEFEDYVQQPINQTKSTIINNINCKLHKVLINGGDDALKEFTRYTDYVINAIKSDISKQKKWDIVMCQLAFDREYMKSRLMMTLSPYVNFAQ